MRSYFAMKGLASKEICGVASAGKHENLSLNARRNDQGLTLKLSVSLSSRDGNLTFDKNSFSTNF